MMGMRSFCLVLGCPLVMAACTSMPQTGQFAGKGAAAAGEAVSTTADGLGGAAQAPLKDFNLVREEAPPALARAYARPYDRAGMDTCAGVSAEIGELDLALGPDVDTPQADSGTKDVMSKGAALAAEATLDSVRAAAEGVVPVRSWIRRFSGANEAEKEAKAIALSGAVRRGFLKAVGQNMGCEWPAAPLAPVVHKIEPAPTAPPPAKKKH